MSRLAAFALLAFAAFDWPAPWLDRAGAALLGLAFAAIAVGRPAAMSRPALLAPAPPPALEVMPDFEPAGRTLPDRIAAYDEGV